MKFVPILQPRIWGGRNLAKLSKKLPPRERVGESWEISDRVGARSLIANGPLARKSLTWVWDQVKRAGTRRQGATPFPWLVKWLDCVQAVSIQIHPHRSIDGEPKNEAWYVVAANRDAKVWAGLRKGITRADLVRAIQNHSIENCLRSFRPRVGEMVLIPAGCIHSVRGVVLLEIQQNSDTTYRFSDWGRGRELQIESGMAALELASQPRRSKSATSPFFQVRTRSFCKVWSPPQEMAVVCISKGAGWVRWSGGKERFRSGDCWLLPSGLKGCSFEPQRETVAVVVVM